MTTTYKPYQKPSITGITMALGQGTQQAIYDGVLSYQPDVERYADAIGASAVNALETPATGLTFGGPLAFSSDPTVAQPWMVTWDGKTFFFAGPDIIRQIAATKAVMGVATAEYPGTYEKQSDGTWDFIPQPVATPAPVPVVANPADVAGWNAAMNLPSVSNEQIMQAIGALAKFLGAPSPGIS